MSESRSWLNVPVAILIGAVLIAGSVLYIGAGSTPSDDGTAAIGSEDTTPVALSDPDALVTDTAPVLGDPDAPVTIVEFSDFQCPYCRSFWLSTYPQLKENYIDTGQVRLVYRNFPLSFHPAAEPAARGGFCAAEQDKFWEYHDAVFAGQMEREPDPTQVSTTISFTEDDIKAWAREGGLDGAAFDACLDSGNYAEAVQNDIADATIAINEANVQNEFGTPGFFVNGFPLIGAQPYSVFSAAIDSEL